MSRRKAKHPIRPLDVYARIDRRPYRDDPEARKLAVKTIRSMGGPEEPEESLVTMVCDYMDPWR